MKLIAIEHLDDNSLKPVIIDLSPEDLALLGTHELSAIDFGMHVIMTKGQAQRLLDHLKAVIGLL